MNANLDLNGEIKRLRKEIADDLSYTRKDRTIRRRKASPDSKPRSRALVLAGGGLLLAILLIALFLGHRNKPPLGNTGVKEQTKLNQLEESIKRLEGMEQKIVSLEEREKKLRYSFAEMDGARRSLKNQVDNPGQMVDEQQKKTASDLSKTEDQGIRQSKPDTPTPKCSYSRAPLTIQRMPFSLPKSRYHEVRPGENLYRIARQCGTSVDELCRLNHIAPKQAIHPGQKLLVALGDQE